MCCILGRNSHLRAALFDGRLYGKVMVPHRFRKGTSWLQILPKHRLPPKSIANVSIFLFLKKHRNVKLTPFIFRVLRLERPRIFQDSSLALECFLDNLDRASKLREIHVSKSVSELVDFDFQDKLGAIGAGQHLNTLALRGLKCVEINQEAMTDFVRMLLKNCSNSLRYLDLSHSDIDDLACQILWDFQLNGTYLLVCYRDWTENGTAVHILTQILSQTRKGSTKLAWNHCGWYTSCHIKLHLNHCFLWLNDLSLKL